MIARGDRMTGQDLLDMARAAQSALRARAGYGAVGAASDRGISFGVEPDAEDLRDCVRAVHTTNAVAPLFGLVEFYGGLEADEGPSLMTMRRPMVSAADRLGILRWEGCSYSDVPWVQIAGVSAVRVGVSRTLKQGERLTSFRNSYNAFPFACGHIRVLQDAGAVEGETNVRLAIVHFTEEP